MLIYYESMNSEVNSVIMNAMPGDKEDIIMVENIEFQPRLKQAKVKDGFWGYFQKLVLEQVIPYQERILRDEIPEIEKSHVIENFRIAAGLEKGDFYGMVFQDSDLAKWMEAVSNAMAISEDPWFRTKAAEMIELIGKAQEEDGYLDTYFQIKAPDKKWTDLQEAHELYCMGHMIEATVANYEATGKDDFLNIGKKMADCIGRQFGKEAGKKRGIPGHPEVEIALLRLYHATGERRYLESAEYFINERGTEPDYFEEEAKRRDLNVFGMDSKDRDYAQNNKPVRELTEAVGHAVRAAYLYTAMADLAADIHDEELQAACERLWNNIVNQKMYVTGGIGSTVHGEAFTIPYDLPNDTVYAETCASVAMVFFAREMLQMNPSGRYADVMEKELYNTVLSGMQHDGTRFFYVNPLEVDPSVSGKVPGYEHVLPKRPQWYACACCPPNVSRCITALSKYAWGENAHTIYAHLYVGGSFASSCIPGVSIDVESEYPWKGNVCYTIGENKENREFTLAIRIPAWARNTAATLRLRHGEEEISRSVSVEESLRDGYLYLSDLTHAGDRVEIRFDMPVRRIYANPKVRKDAGLVAIMRGPIVYALEEKDNGAELYALSLPEHAQFATEETTDPVLGTYVRLSADGYRDTSDGESLYSEKKPETVGQKLTFVPYYLWGNRGIGEMRVWVRSEG